MLDALLLPGSHAAAVREERRAQLKRYVESEITSMRPYLYLTRAFAVASVIAVIAFIYAGIDNNAFSSVLFFQLETDFGAVIDAGSHGSRLHLYQWPARIHDPDHPLSGPISLPVEVFSLRAVPGISATIDDDPSRTGELCIGPLIDQLRLVLTKMRISQDRWGDIPLFVKATAGMRDLDSASRSAIMNSIREFVANFTPFLFHWSWARITAGEEEGVYGWLTVNSALGTLLMPAGETFGAMDLGGASMQITYAPLRTSVLESYNGVSLGGQGVHLYSHSSLGYGWGDSMTRLTTRLAVESIIETLQAEGFDELHFEDLNAYLLEQQAALADATATLIFPPTLSRSPRPPPPRRRQLRQDIANDNVGHDEGDDATQADPSIGFNAADTNAADTNAADTNAADTNAADTLPLSADSKADAGGGRVESVVESVVPLDSGHPYPSVNRGDGLLQEPTASPQADALDPLPLPVENLGPLILPTQFAQPTLDPLSRIADNDATTSAAFLSSSFLSSTTGTPHSESTAPAADVTAGALPAAAGAQTPAAVSAASESSSVSNGSVDGPLSPLNSGGSDGAPSPTAVPSSIAANPTGNSMDSSSSTDSVPTLFVEPAGATLPPNNPEAEDGGDDDVGAPHPRYDSDTLSALGKEPLLVHIRAVHPCYPLGHAFQFYLPSLAEPEGRLYLDVDLSRLISFTRFAGVQESFLQKIVVPRVPNPVGGLGDIPEQVDEVLNSARTRSAAGNLPDGSLPISRTRPIFQAPQFKTDPAAYRRRLLTEALPSLDSMTTAERKYYRRRLEANRAALLLNEFHPLHYTDPDDNGDEYGDPSILPLLDAEGGSDHRRNLFDESPGESDRRESLFSHSAGMPFRPLNGALPLEGTPRVQYVIDFEGSSDPDSCRTRARDLFYDMPCFVHSCSFNGVYQPSKEGSQFIAFGQFSRVQQALNVTANPAPAQIAAVADDVCRLTRQELQDAHQVGMYAPYGRNGVLLLCWKALWTYTVLNWGFGFPANSTQITFAQTVGEGPNARIVGWADGSMIAEVNNFPWKTPLGRFEVPFVLASLLALLFAVTTWLVMIQLRSRGRIIKLAGLDTSSNHHHRGARGAAGAAGRRMSTASNRGVDGAGLHHEGGYIESNA